jgi:hypothetical protein
LFEKPESSLKPLYFKNQSRLTSVTDINIISRDLIVVLHRYAGMVYLININSDLTNYKIIDKIKIKYGGNQFQTEALTRKDNRLYIITFTEYLVIVDIIDNKHLKFVTEVKLNNPGCYYHGLEINDNNLYIVPSIVSGDNMHIVKINLNQSDIQIQKIVTDEFKKNTGKYRIKDISFLPDGKILLIIMINNGKTRMSDFSHADMGFIHLYTSDYGLLDTYQLGEVHADALITNGNEFYLTVTDPGGGFIYKGFINNEKNTIENIKKTQIAGFPHGIYINQECNLLGFTSYSTDSAYLMNLDEFNNMRFKNL